MRTWILISAWLISNTLTAQRHTVSDGRLAGLDTAFARVLRQWNCPGFAVAVVEKNEVIYAQGFGYADYERKIPATPHTLYAAGSCTKAFTAALLGILRDEKKVDFDKPAVAYLPQLQFYNGGMNSGITLRDMMCHRTGLPRHDLAWALFKTASADTLLRRIQYLEPNAGLREKFQYNNFMYLAQGKTIEAITGRDYKEYLTEKILQPLEITNISFSTDTMAANNDAARGYTVTSENMIVKTDYFNLDVMSPVGGMNTSAHEMAKWIMLWLNNGVFRGQRILPEKYVREAISSQMIISGALPAAANPGLYFNNYGLGWFLSSYRGHYRVEHGGTITGFTANNCFFPSDSIGIVVLCNQNLSPVTSIVRNLIADRLLQLPYKDWQTYLYTTSQRAKAAAPPPAPAPEKASRIQLPPASIYTGSYTHRGYGTFRIISRNDSLWAVFPNESWWLRPVEKHVFEGIPVSQEGNPGTRLVFTTDKAGGIFAATMQLEPDLPLPIVFEKMG